MPFDKNALLAEVEKLDPVQRAVYDGVKGDAPNLAAALTLAKTTNNLAQALTVARKAWDTDAVPPRQTSTAIDYHRNPRFGIRSDADARMIEQARDAYRERLTNAWRGG